MISPAEKNGGWTEVVNNKFDFLVPNQSINWGIFSIVNRSATMGRVSSVELKATFMIKEKLSQPLTFSLTCLTTCPAFHNWKFSKMQLLVDLLQWSLIMNFQPYMHESIIWSEKTPFQSPLPTNKQKKKKEKAQWTRFSFEVQKTVRYSS